MLYFLKVFASATNHFCSVDILQNRFRRKKKIPRIDKIVTRANACEAPHNQLRYLHALHILYEISLLLFDVKQKNPILTTTKKKTSTWAKNNDKQKKKATHCLSFADTILPFCSVKRRTTRKQLNQNKFMDAFLAFMLLQCSKTIEILVKGTQMQQPTNEKRKSDSFVLVNDEKKRRKKETTNTIIELHMQRCNTDISMNAWNTCAKRLYYTIYALSYHVGSNDLIELCSKRVPSFLCTVHSLNRLAAYTFTSHRLISLFNHIGLWLFENVDHHCFACYYLWFE